MKIVDNLANLFLELNEATSEKEETFEYFIIKYHVNDIKTPTLEDLKGAINNSNTNDKIRIDLELDSADKVSLHSNKLDQSKEFLEELNVKKDIQRDDSIFTLTINLIKKLNNDTLNIYCYSEFEKFLKGKSLKNLLHIFNEIITHKNTRQLFFHDQPIKFQTQTINFGSYGKTPEQNSFNRNELIKQRNEVCHFNQSSNFDLIPHDFHITNISDGQQDYFTGLIKKLSIVFSVIFLADVTEIIDDDHLYFKINGYKAISNSITLDDIDTNSAEHFFDIVEWVYNKGDINDKIGLTRNILSTTSSIDSLIITDNTFPSILSNYKIYLKSNVEQYIKVKNKISDHLVEANQKAGDIVNEFSTSFRNNFFAFFSFFFTVIIIRVINVSKTQNIFTEEIAALSYAFLLTSIIYLGVTIWHSLREKNRFDNVYNNLKDRYGNLLHEDELRSIFVENKDHDDDLTFINFNIALQSFIWLSVIIGLFYLTYRLSGYSIIYFSCALF